MTYEYFCDSCDAYFDVVKHHSEYRKPERCLSCNKEAVRQFAPRHLQLVGTAVQEAEYNPGLGCIVKNKQERAEICRRRGLLEVGNEPAESLHKHYDRAREERRERAWAEADRGWVGNEG